MRLTSLEHNDKNIPDARFRFSALEPASQGLSSDLLSRRQLWDSEWPKGVRVGAKADCYVQTLRRRRWESEHIGGLRMNAGG